MSKSILEIDVSDLSRMTHPRGGGEFTDEQGKVVKKHFWYVIDKGVCPICGKGGKKNNWCEVRDDGMAVICNHDLSGESIYGEDVYPTRMKQGFNHYFGKKSNISVKPVKFNNVPTIKQLPLADASTRDTVYRLVLKYYPLVEKDRENLLARGLNNEDVDGKLFGSLVSTKPIDRWSKIFAENNLPSDIWKGVPGFAEQVFGDKTLVSFGYSSLTYEKDGKRVNSLKDGDSMLMVPYRNNSLQIVGIQLRSANYTGNGSKYFWVSSSSENNGASVSQEVNFALPTAGMKRLEQQDGKLSTKTVWLTEGGLKSEVAVRQLVNIATDITKLPNQEDKLARFLDDYGLTVIAVAGTAVWRKFIDVLQESQVKRVIVAYDSDWKTNETVAARRNELIEALRIMDVTLIVADWDGSNGKGIDDLLANGYWPSLETL